MGRKVQTNPGPNKPKETNKKSKPAREEKELTESIDSLLRITTLPVQTNVNQSFECQKQISALIDRIRLLEEKLSKKHNKSITQNNVQSQRQEAIVNFSKWLKDNGAELHGCTIAHFEGYDLGIKVEQDIAKNSLVIAVPRQIMLTTENARKGKLGRLVNEVEILKNMPNVLLAIYLLIEKFSDNSFWKPYLDVLPKSYSTVLYFSVNELEELKGSPTLELALKQIKSIARQYAFFRKLFWKLEDPISELMRSKFTFNEYCWAVSTVMTRQNMVPSEDGSTTINALIPLWDMCNHSNGTISTDYIPESKRSECLAFKDFKKGEQLFIFYGYRTNTDFFVHNGFVFDENENDTYPIRLGISKSDPLQEKRRELLNRLGIESAGEFYIRKGPNPVDKRLLAFLRVFNMESDQLDNWLGSPEKVFEDVLDSSLDSKCWNFLKTRLTLLLASYKTVLDEDEALIQTGNLSENARVALKMRMAEKRLLRDGLKFVEEKNQN